MNENKKNISDTKHNFDNFLRKRQEKQHILLSQTEPIANKIHSFDLLLRLSKAGTVLPFHQNKTTDKNTQNDKYAMKKFKTQKILSEKEQKQTEKFDEQQDNREVVFGKLNKMTSEVNAWDLSKKNSKHEGNINKLQKDSTTKPQRDSSKHQKDSTNKYLNSKHEEPKKVKKHVSIQQGEDKKKYKEKSHYHTYSKFSRLNSPKNRNSPHFSGNSPHLEDEKVDINKNQQNPNEDRQFQTAFYAPIKKEKVSSCIKRMNRRMKRSPFQPAKTTIAIKEYSSDFQKLQKTIDSLQEKAKTRYGIEFRDFKSAFSEENQNMNIQDECQSQREHSEKQNCWVQPRQLNTQGYARVVKANLDNEDASIPSFFLSVLPPTIQKKVFFRNNSRPSKYVRI